MQRRCQLRRSFLSLALVTTWGCASSDVGDSTEDTGDESSESSAADESATTGDGDGDGESGTTGDGDGDGDGDGEGDGDGDGDTGAGENCFFGELTPIDGAETATFAAVADLDGNGYGDIVIDGVHAYLGDEMLDFAESVASIPDVGGNIEPWEPRAALIDGDEHVDLVVSAFGAGFLFGKGDGTGAFEFAAFSPPPGTTTPSFLLEVADLDGDGAQDVLLRGDPSLLGPSTAMSVYVYLGDGEGDFSYEGSIPLAGHGRKIEVADFNGDSLPDLIADVRPFGVEVFLGNGSASPDAGTTYDIGTQEETGFTVGDLNADQVPDVIVWEYVRVLLGDGTGGFGAPSEPQLQGAGVLPPFDANDDGHADVIGQHGSVLRLHLGDGEGGFSSTCEITHDGEWFGHVTSGDLDGDGRTDLAFSHPTLGLGYALGN